MRHAAAPEDTACVPQRCEPGLGTSLLRLLSRGDDTKLLQQTEVIIGKPALHDLAAFEPEQLQATHRDAPEGRREARQVARMCGVVGPTFGDRIALGQQLVNRDMQVWAAGAECAQRRLETVTVAYVRGSRIMMHVAVSEELV